MVQLSKCEFCLDVFSLMTTFEIMKKCQSTTEMQTDTNHIQKAKDSTGGILENFQIAINKAMDGVSPGPQWWCGDSAKAFRNIANDLVPIIIQRQEPYASSYMYPAKSLLRYNGIIVNVHRGEGASYWQRGHLAGLSEVWRTIVLQVLARLMINPSSFCHFQFKYLSTDTYSFFKEQDDLLHVFMSMLSYENLKNIWYMSEKWPNKARIRVNNYIRNPIKYYIF